MFRNFKIILLMITMSISGGVFATAQKSDNLIIEGKEFRLYTNPLKSQLELKEWEPPKEARIWSSNWRGYIATWEIKNNQLYLKDVTIQVDDPNSDEDFDEVSKSILTTLFPGENKVFADWYNGTLVVPDGEMTNYVHMGYGSTYERYWILQISSGKVIKNLKMSQEEFLTYKEDKFKEFRETSKFKQELYKLTGDEYGWSTEEAIGFIQSFYAEHYLSL